MTRFVIIAILVLTACFTVKCQADSLDNAEQPQSQKENNDAPGAEETDRMGGAKNYAPFHVGPPSQNVPIKFVDCYSCVDCPKVLPNTTSKYCPYTNDPTKNYKCVVYAEKYKQMKKTWLVRGCASERGSCADIRRSHENNFSVKLTFCIECDGNRCNTNGVSRSTIDFTTALFVLVLCPILGKYTLA